MILNFILIFIIKFIDQVLRVLYLITIKKSHKVLATVIVGLQQIIHIYIIVFIINDYSISNVIALVSSTMLATYLINNKYNSKIKEDTK